jgi:hypothetical protein
MGTSLVTIELSYGFRRLRVSRDRALTYCPLMKSLSYEAGDELTSAILGTADDAR